MKCFIIFAIVHKERDNYFAFCQGEFLVWTPCGGERMETVGAPSILLPPPTSSLNTSKQNLKSFGVKEKKLRFSSLSSLKLARSKIRQNLSAVFDKWELEWECGMWNVGGEGVCANRGIYLYFFQAYSNYSKSLGNFSFRLWLCYCLKPWKYSL